MPDNLEDGLRYLEGLVYKHGSNYYPAGKLRDAGVDALLKCIPQYEPSSGDFKVYAITWMERAIINRVKNIARRDRAQAKVRIAPGIEREASPEVKARANSILKACTKPERRMLEMITDGWTQKEIGKEMGILQSTVSMRLDNIRRRLAG